MPKGHPEGNETPLESAKRELFEETGLSVVRLFSEESLVESYEFSSRGRPIRKTVNYFVAEVAGDVRIQREELTAGKWVELPKVHDVVTYAQMKALLQKVVGMVMGPEAQSQP